ncbi:MAG TPA: glycosyltransferase [Bacteroidales bacterium]|nr:glycosyltransferase [Bacteroidales bacterium]
MDLSIVIVNYNVKYFIEQCLHSVKKAVEGIHAEVFVVDNNSVDGSCNFIREKFPWVNLIANQENVGFSKANNQAIEKSAGRYVLLLNPDTIIEEDTLHKCLAFMDSHADCGGLGVKMIDGKGQFLPESKRSLPTPGVAFYKIFGFSALFPKSHRFGKYHLGYLDEDQTHIVDVLAGAYMFLRREALDKTGLLDEDYFMYGEDIDLSYRIVKQGYKNYYFPGTTIIHYKGESTKKGSLNYVLVFYRAMIIFARKHLSDKNARLYKILINVAIYLRAALAIMRRFVKRVYMQFVDAVLIFFGFFAGLPLWESMRFDKQNYYPDEYLYFIVPAYIIIWLTAIYYSGGYDKPLRIWRHMGGVIVGTLSILVVYALLPETLRFSRAAILFGTVWTMGSTGLLRWVLHLAGIKDYQLETGRLKRIVIVGYAKEADRVSQVLSETQIKPELIGYVSPDEVYDTPFLGSVSQIDEICRVHQVDEILFCAENITSQRIIDIMTRLTNAPVNYKIAPPESLSIIGSNSINTSGDLYTIHFNSIGKKPNQRSKRLFDILVSILLLVSFPVWFFVVKRPLNAWYSLLLVFIGMRTIVGYETSVMGHSIDLPALRKGLLSPATNSRMINQSDEKTDRLNVMYAKDYKLSNDLQILIKGFRYLGGYY